ncbi:hypothetical protein BDM02DRAFT_3106206, partial [Thelephora ganbajun]
QFPARLAFSIAVNKSQGQSIKRIRISLRVLVFSHGQLHVALSQVTNSQNVKILLPKDQERACTTSVVYPKVLADEVSNLRRGILLVRSHSHLRMETPWGA